MLLSALLSKNSLLVFEIVLSVLLIGVARMLPRRTTALTQAFARAFAKVARHRALTVLLVGLFGFATSMGLALWKGIPVPFVSDEFSYLLAADTFAHGRLTNPTHPMWIHFETLGIIQQPTNMSKYPPGQGMILALGKVFGGHPIVGVWLSIGLMSAAICWMLVAWLPARWAFLGGLLASLQLGGFGFWSQGYMGGAVAATGGALFYGALPRLMRSPGAGQPLPESSSLLPRGSGGQGRRAKYALLTGLGLVILANSRPFEGMVTALPGLVWLGLWLLGRRQMPLAARVRQVVLPLGAALALLVLWMGYYNFRVTGSPRRMPYMVHEEAYAVAPAFIWQPLRPMPHYHHESMRVEYTGQQELGNYQAERTLTGFLELSLTKIRVHWRFYFGETLTLPLIALVWLGNNRKVRFVLIPYGLLLMGMLVTMAWGTHYEAPAAGLIFVLIMQGMRTLWLWKWKGSSAGRAVVCAVVLTCLIAPLLAAAHAEPLPEWRLDRVRIQKQLEQQGGKHLIVVLYTPEHNSHNEWIYNDADIDNAKVVWARMMDRAENRRLLDYFKDRQVWLLEADSTPPRLTPFPADVLAK